MSFVVVSSYEVVNAGDLQEPGQSVAVFPNEAIARERYAARLDALNTAARGKKSEAGVAQAADASLVVWAALLELPVQAEDIDEALETIEMIIEEAEDIEEELDYLMIDYTGTVHTPDGESPYPRKNAIDNLQAWLS